MHRIMDTVNVYFVVSAHNTHSVCLYGNLEHPIHISYVLTRPSIWHLLRTQYTILNMSSDNIICQRFGARWNIPATVTWWWRYGTDVRTDQPCYNMLTWFGNVPGDWSNIYHKSIGVVDSVQQLFRNGAIYATTEGLP